MPTCQAQHSLCHDQMPKALCINVRIDMCIDMRIDMCFYLCLGMHNDMCIDMCVDMCVGMGADICGQCVKTAAKLGLFPGSATQCCTAAIRKSSGIFVAGTPTTVAA